MINSTLPIGSRVVLSTSFMEDTNSETTVRLGRGLNKIGTLVKQGIICRIQWPDIKETTSYYIKELDTVTVIQEIIYEINSLEKILT